MKSQYCFVIPNYNHTQAIAHTVDDLVQYGLSIIIIDDGSNAETQAVLGEIATKHELVTLFRRAINGGKGAAVQTGLQLAHQMSMSHAIQVDADGQHNLDDISRLVECSKLHPQALVSGRPVYDGSISKGRYYGRFITHFWVYIETLSFSIKDSMCGFRVYPLDAYTQLASKVALGNRMDFDIEVMVRLYWQGLPVHFIPTKVLYPPNGVSHFMVWKDNWLISKMHTALFFGMLWRLPALVARHFRSRT